MLLEDENHRLHDLRPVVPHDVVDVLESSNHPSGKQPPVQLLEELIY